VDRSVCGGKWGANEPVNTPEISIIIPTFNEKENVRTIAGRVREVMAERDIRYEILFVDDSRDETPEVLAMLARLYPEVRYVHRTGQRGLATAVLEGFRLAKGRYLIVMDADLQHPPELIPDIVHHLRAGIDVVIPSRFVPGGSDGGLSPFRKLVSWTARTIGRLAIRRLRSLTDITSGYFGIRAEVIQGVEFNPIGWKILMEVLVKGHYESVIEIPYAFQPRDAGASKMSLREQWNYLRHVARLVASSPDDRRFFLFCFVGALGVVVNLIVMSVLVYMVRWHGAGPSIVASLVAMLHNFVWNDQVTWRGHAHPVRWRRMLQVPLFMLISTVSIIITAMFAELFHRLGWNELLGQLLGIAAGTVWSFAANNRWTWGSAKESKRSRMAPVKIRKERP
jgi:dolichol-phosphate mannosyltransferase